MTRGNLGRGGEGQLESMGTPRPRDLGQRKGGIEEERDGTGERFTEYSWYPPITDGE